LKAKEKALAIATQLAAKKGLDIEIFDLSEISSFTDFFVICTGTSNRHVKTLADETLETARQHGERSLGVEGDPPGRWILVDLGDVVVHLFESEAREFYALERLWGEADPVPVPEADAERIAEAR
jgi:ribosome-associated protein